MESLSALAGRGADQHNVAAGTLPFHLRHTVFHQAKKTINVNSLRGPPLLVAHLINWHILRRPNTCIPVSTRDFAASLESRVAFTATQRSGPPHFAASFSASTAAR